MGGLFGFINYNRPGPGVPKDAPPKPRLIVFFEVYTRKFWHLVKLNMLFFAFNILALIPIVGLFSIFSGAFQELMKGDSFFRTSMLFSFCAVFLSIPLITTGPAQAGFTYVLRNFSREEHAFIWLDFKEHAIKNFKQSLLISIIDFFVILIIFIDINIYTNTNINSFPVSIAVFLASFFFFIFVMMHLYIYPMLVTFKLSLKSIYKNAFIFAVVKFLPNTIIVLLCTALSAIPFLVLPSIGIMLFPVITLSTIGLITNFYVYPTLEKYMLKRN
jgi:uncharacterized membrane protein YesL